MSTKSAPYYWLECDDCGVRSTEDGDYMAWGTIGDAQDEAVNGEWAIGIDGKDYCDQCAPYPYCDGCNERNARTEYLDETFCDDCIEAAVRDAEQEAAS